MKLFQFKRFQSQLRQRLNRRLNPQPQWEGIQSLEPRMLLSADILPHGNFVAGTVFNDLNADGQQSNTEPPLGGVVVYADLNNNGQLDNSEPRTESHSINNTDPATGELSIAGNYFLPVPSGEMTIRQILPDGFRQTFPLSHLDAELRNQQVERVGHGRSLSYKVTDVITEPSVTASPLPHAGVAVEISVVWPDTNSYFATELTEVKISEDGIRIDTYGNFRPGAGLQVLTEESQTVRLGDLRPGEYKFTSVQHEQTGDFSPHYDTTWEITGVLVVRPDGGHHVIIHDNSFNAALNFGNHKIDVEPEPAAVGGTKFNDLDGNGRRSNNEPGLAGVIIYADYNNDGQLNTNEPFTRTQEDNPNTAADETGHFWLEGLRPGQVTIREVVPDGWVQTSPGFQVVDVRTESIDVGPGTSLSFELTNAQTDVSGIVPALNLQHTVVWRDGCGHLLPQLTEASRDYNHIRLNMFGEHAGGICTDALVTETNDYSIGLIEPGVYEVRTVLHERTLPLPWPYPDPIEYDAETGEPIIIDEGGVVWPYIEPEFNPSWVVESTIIIGGADGYRLDLEPGDEMRGLIFGNKKIDVEPEPGNIVGLKFNDLNANGQRDANEPGLPGVTIYLDLNNNGQHENNEPATKTLEDNPNTKHDESGHFWFDGIRPGEVVVREIVPDGWEQTFPREGRGHEIIVEPGSTVDGVFFGNHEIIVEPEPGTVEGIKFYDRNLNGQQDPWEHGLGGVIIFADINNNGKLDEGEPRTKTWHEDPYTDFDEGGLYILENVPAGEVVIREVVPRGWIQTFPRLTSGHIINMPSAGHVSDIDFGNRKRRIIWGDINRDEKLDHEDLKRLIELIHSFFHDAETDLSQDGQTNMDDLNVLVEDIFRTRKGDVNLDGKVNIQDLARMASKFGQSGDWADGDMNGDGLVNVQDLSQLASGFGFEGEGVLEIELPNEDDAGISGADETGSGALLIDTANNSSSTNDLSWDHIGSLLTDEADTTLV